MEMFVTSSNVQTGMLDGSPPSADLAPSARDLDRRAVRWRPTWPFFVLFRARVEFALTYPSD